MAGKVRNISVLVNDQLPEFITTEYPKLVSFLSKYYEQLELSGQPLDLIQNLTKYNDIDTYNREILHESTILTASVSETSNSIEVETTESFPKVNGYILINDEGEIIQDAMSIDYNGDFLSDNPRWIRDIIDMKENFYGEIDDEINKKDQNNFLLFIKALQKKGWF